MASCQQTTIQCAGSKQLPSKPVSYGNRLTRLYQTHSSELVETAFSPLKYAVFALTGSSGLRWSGVALASSLPNGQVMSKVGCVGGAVLAVLFAILLFSRSPAQSDGTSSNHEDPAVVLAWRRTARVVFDESLYSGMASALGAAACAGTGSWKPFDHLPYIAAGALGPPILVVGFFTVVGAACGVRWTYNKALDWWTGYL
ncbi:hypothetical protein BKA70DRAFT_723046 [Coprinopsis sp. MPI-PUGE-AT-0042]|nr:hypothetical protein BKA70DRAFT_723046 [Coprinopsis sp. MPI-PUGE-AT-0042]